MSNITCELAYDTSQEIVSPNRNFSGKDDAHALCDIDCLVVSEDWSLSFYLADVFDKSEWEIVHTTNWADAAAIVRNNRVAVLISDDELSDGSWDVVAKATREIPNSPALIVISEKNLSWEEIAERGGYDLLRPPFKDAHVIWSIASAWHHWMKQAAEHDLGALRCSDA